MKPWSSVGKLREGRRVGDHLVRDAGQLFDGRGNAVVGPDEARPFAHAAFIDLDDADLGDRIAR
jgi:hypothetical protein